MFPLERSLRYLDPALRLRGTKPIPNQQILQIHISPILKHHHPSNDPSSYPIDSTGVSGSASVDGAHILIYPPDACTVDRGDGTGGITLGQISHISSNTRRYGPGSPCV